MSLRLLLKRPCRKEFAASPPHVDDMRMNLTFVEQGRVLCYYRGGFSCSVMCFVLLKFVERLFCSCDTFCESLVSGDVVICKHLLAGKIALCAGSLVHEKVKDADFSARVLQQ
jgi:predicted nucleic acid-binding Zn finger protein